jgi:sugar porter (SP) family MFS transporter
MVTTTQTQGSEIEANYNFGYIWVVSIVAALGGLLFGWDWVVIGGAKPFFERYFQIHDPVLVGWANSCALVGCLAGALAAGALSDRWGRKKLLIFSALLFGVTSIGNGLAPTLLVFVFWRILGGVAIGLASNLSPMYIAEIAPARLRGRLVSINQLTITTGALLAQIINWRLSHNLPHGASDEFIRTSWFGQQGWRWMFGLTAGPALLFFLGMLFVPESPRWLMKNGKVEAARRILTSVGGSRYAEASSNEIQSTLASEEIQRVRFSDLLEPGMRRVLMLGVVLAVFQQWCGINVIFNYAEEIFGAGGYDVSAVLKNIACTGSVAFLATIAALGIVDRGGRRPLMLFGSASLALIFFALSLCYHAGLTGRPILGLVLAAIGCYAMSLAPITWVVISEIFPNRIRGAAMAVAVSALWVACFILTITFPSLWAHLGLAGVFGLYGVVCVGGFVFIRVYLPETKGKTLEEIERALVD